ncbi:unnamed protein product [Paramecium primaurelia]|uniref:Transmembrane protein n=1 Tax=Paramecium primaurelia TaxID=5886 RepID=A0A8S1QJE6_PARPR|nr:unnamed protein product [Paramecium primaurelia]
MIKVNLILSSTQLKSIQKIILCFIFLITLNFTVLQRSIERYEDQRRSRERLNSFGENKSTGRIIAKQNQKEQGEINRFQQIKNQQQ